MICYLPLGVDCKSAHDGIEQEHEIPIIIWSAVYYQYWWWRRHLVALAAGELPYYCLWTYPLDASVSSFSSTASEHATF